MSVWNVPLMTHFGHSPPRGLPHCLEISGWDVRTRLDKDERKIVRRHRDKLE